MEKRYDQLDDIVEALRRMRNEPARARGQLTDARRPTVAPDNRKAGATEPANPREEEGRGKG